MDMFKAIDRRYSYRGAFRDRPIPRAHLKRIVGAALKAPSGCNAQTTTFVVVDSPRILGKIHGMHEMQAMRDARALIAFVVARRPAPVYSRESFEVEDCSAAVMNAWLALTALGYASVWIDGWLRLKGRADELGRLLKVPRNRVIRVILPVGIPVSPGPRRIKKAFNQRAWFNRHK